MIFVMAGLVIGVVVFALIVNHRRPDETDFIRHFEQATRDSQHSAARPALADNPVLKLRKRDFRSSYIGRTPLQGWRGDVQIDPDLGHVAINSDLNIDGSLRVGAGTTLRINGDVNVGGAVYIASSLLAERTIESGLSIHCGDTIESLGSIFCSGTIGCGRCVRAAGSIMAREGIRAGEEISSGEAIHAGGTIEAPSVNAGRVGDPRTITCSRLLRGRISNGDLVETEGNSRA